MAKRKTIAEQLDDAENGDMIIIDADDGDEDELDAEPVDIVPEVVEDEPEPAPVVVEVVAPEMAMIDRVLWATNTLKQIARGAEPPDVPPVLETLLPNDAAEGAQVLLMDWRSFRIYAVRSKAGWQVQPVVKQ